AAGAVEREHREAAKRLAQRVVAHEPLQLTGDLRVAAEREVRFEPLLERREAELVQPVDLVACERLLLEAGERPTPPKAERRAQRSLPRPPGCELGAVVPDGERAEDPEFQTSNVTPATAKLHLPRTYRAAVPRLPARRLLARTIATRDQRQKRRPPMKTLKT